MTPENRLRRKIRDSLTVQELAYGGRLTFWSVADAYMAGLPDLMAVLDGHFFALELKASQGSLEPIQKFMLLQYHRAGATAGIIRADEEAPLGFTFERIDGDPADRLVVPCSTHWVKQIRRVV